MWYPRSQNRDRGHPAFVMGREWESWGLWYPTHSSATGDEWMGHGAFVVGREWENLDLWFPTRLLWWVGGLSCGEAGMLGLILMGGVELGR